MLIDDTFQFDCRMCGACCREDREIVLNPYDIFMLSRRFKSGTRDFLSRWCRVEMESGVGAPLAMLRTEGGACVFLTNDQCAVHPARPACCRNYPVGTLFEPNGTRRHVAVDPDGDCPGAGSGTTRMVADWHVESGVETARAGIELLRQAAAAVRFALTMTEKNELFQILYDFDSLPESEGGGAGDASETMERLGRRLEALFAAARPRYSGSS